MEDLLSKIEQCGILPVIKIDDARDAVPLADAIIKGGLPAAEVTFRTMAAEAAIRNIVSKFPEMLVGAGTVLTPDQARIALNSGAQFIVSPGFNPMVVDFCLEQGVLVMPGISTPTELEAAMSKGLTLVKFFPAGALGGLAYLKSMSAPYSGVHFIPTGGVDASNLLDYLKFNKVLACGGSWMVKADLIAAHQFERITALVAEAVATILGFHLHQIRLNASSESLEMVASFSRDIFHLPTQIGEKGLRLGEILELAPINSPGEIVIGTNFLFRAVAYFEQNDIALKSPFDPEKNEVLLDQTVNGLQVVVRQV